MPIFTITVKDDERMVLDAAKDAAEFTKHPKFDTVEIAEASLDVLPYKLKRLIASTRRKVLEVGIVRATEVPAHVHENDSEIYFYGDESGHVSLLDENLVATGRGSSDFIGPNTCAVTWQGSGHRVLTGIGPAVFFNVKLGDVEESVVDEDRFESLTRRHEMLGNLVVEGEEIPVKLKVMVIAAGAEVVFVQANFHLESKNPKHAEVISRNEIVGTYRRELEIEFANHLSVAGSMVQFVRRSLPKGVFFESNETDNGDLACNVFDWEEGSTRPRI
jgi:hypothetical protein